jgi:gamma-glutamylcyclotransferase (GGCT)/AIG2-like uncharacterized protein YtfP
MVNSVGSEADTNAVRMNNAYLFVYGTLRRVSNSEMFQQLARQADFVGEASYQGRLYKIDGYPGVVPSKNKTDLVQGEVYQLHDANLLSQLDDYEECSAGFLQPTEYVRELCEVRLKNDQLIQAWFYRYNRPIDTLELLASGDFLIKNN